MFVLHFDPDAHPECNGIFKIQNYRDLIKLELPLVLSLNEKKSKALKTWVAGMKHIPVLDFLYDRKQNKYLGFFAEKNMARATLNEVMRNMVLRRAIEKIMGEDELIGALPGDIGEQPSTIDSEQETKKMPQEWKELEDEIDWDGAWDTWEDN